MRTVLVIDDDSDIRELVAWKLTQAGYTTLSASDGAEGLATAVAGDSDGRPPDLILVDWTMPKMTGIEVCRSVRAHPLISGIPIILLTANAHEAEVESGFAAGVDDYIIKPFSPRELLGRIQAVLSRSEARR